MSSVPAADDRPHLLVYPFSSSGHIIPLLDLTDHLIDRGLAVTVLVIPQNLPLLRPLLSRHRPPILDALVVPAPEPESSLPQHRLLKRLRAMRDHHAPAIARWFASHPSPPVAIISDFFLGWTHHLARRLGIPRVVFSPSAAFALSVDFALWGQLPRNGDPDRDAEYAVTLSELPNSPSYPWWQLSQFYRMFIGGDPELEFHKDGMFANMGGWGVVINSFSGLEQAYMGHLEKSFFGPGRVWAVGPLLPLDGPATGLGDRGGSSSVPAEDVLAWLDARGDHSVVYVCFGSRMVLTAEETRSLADALESSGVHFVWCVKEDGANSGRAVGGDRGGSVPNEFEDRTSGRGLVIRGWAPQVMILRHRAVGSFLTHCGWNSVLEGLSAGVVMLAWPMGADQYTDAKLLVDQLGVGVRAHEREDSPPDSAELARILARSVDGGIPERARAREMKEAAAAAVSPGGSSDKDLNAFVKALTELKSEAKPARATSPVDLDGLF